MSIRNRTAAIAASLLDDATHVSAARPNARMIGGITLVSAGDHLTALRMELSGPDLDQLDGQDVAIAMFREDGSVALTRLASLSVGHNLMVTGPEAVVLLTVKNEVRLSSIATWWAVITGPRLGADAAPVLVAGEGDVAHYSDADHRGADHQRGHAAA